MSQRNKSALTRRSVLKGGAAGVLASSLARESRAATDASEAGRSRGPEAAPLSLTVNGDLKSTAVEPRATLLDALRDSLDVTGPKRVCDRGTCGACTVLLDGKLAYACSILAVEAEGREVETVESLGAPDELHPLQQAFVDNDAQQCGYCTPGFVLATKVLFDRNPSPSPQEMEEALGGNLCRCGTYQGIHRVLLQVRGEEAV